MVRYMDKRKSVIMLMLLFLCISVRPLVTWGAWVQSEDGSWWNTDQSELGYSVGLTYIDQKYYYFSNRGVMQTGWIKDNGTDRFMQADGSMLVDARTPDGYYVDSSGCWVESVGRLAGGESEISRSEAMRMVDQKAGDWAYALVCDHFVQYKEKNYYVVDVYETEKEVYSENRRYIVSSDGMIVQEGYYYVGEDGKAVIGFY